MAFPDFSEFSFGYAIVRRLEEFAGRLAVPNFPTQNEEADGGYDVDFLAHGVPLFIQFKRSEVMTRRSCREWKDNTTGWFFPIYRMHLHSREAFRQHFLLCALQRAGQTAVYCASCVPAKSDLDRLHASGDTLRAGIVVHPLDIRLPSLDQEHHVSFVSSDGPFRVYSDTGRQMEPRSPTFEALFGEMRTRSEADVDDEMEKLRRFVDGALSDGPDQLAESERKRAIDTRPDVDQPSADREGGVAGFKTYEYDASGWDRLSRIADVRSVVKRAALLAYYEMDAFIVSVPRDQLRK